MAMMWTRIAELSSAGPSQESNQSMQLRAYPARANEAAPVDGVRTRMRGVVIFLGLLVLLAGGALAAAQYLPVDLSPYLSSMPGAENFVRSQTALIAGGAAGALGFVLLMVSAASGGSKKAPRAQLQPASAAPAQASQRANTGPPSQPRTAPQPVQQPKPVVAPQAAAPSPAPAPSRPASAAKPQASAYPPAPVSGVAATETATAATWTQDPRLHNRKRVSDLVSINDALKAYHSRHGSFPKAEGLSGYVQRGAAWIPGLAPDFIKVLPRDPAQSDDPSAPQYLYASNGADYKLLAHGVALAGGTNVEVLGVRIDPSRNPTAERASFGFWTEGFASV
jgi:hypothetical protein